MVTPKRKRRKKPGEANKSKWMTVDICGRTVEINLYRKLPGLHGEHRPEKDEIAVRWSDSAGFCEDTLLHETLIHAIFEGSGLREEITKKLGLTDDKWMEVEELIARVWSPTALAVMKRAGWLTLPPMPSK